MIFVNFYESNFFTVTYRNQYSSQWDIMLDFDILIRGFDVTFSGYVLDLFDSFPVSIRRALKFELYLDWYFLRENLVQT